MQLVRFLVKVRQQVNSQRQRMLIKNLIELADVNQEVNDKSDLLPRQHQSLLVQPLDRQCIFITPLQRDSLPCNLLVFFALLMVPLVFRAVKQRLLVLPLVERNDGISADPSLFDGAASLVELSWELCLWGSLFVFDYFIDDLVPLTLL